MAITAFTPLLASATAVGLDAGNASAAPSSVKTGYFPFGAQGYGSGSACTFTMSSFGTTSFAAQPVVGMAPTANCDGGWLVTADGGVFSEGSTPFYGSTGNIHLNKPIVGMAATPDDHGYWLVASDGGVFAFGDARFYGSTGNIHLNKPIVGMAATPDGRGYWEVASDGGVFAFGDARFYGSTGNIHLNKPIVGMAPAPGGNGYWLVASDGGVFAFGDAHFYGSTGAIALDSPVTTIARTPDGKGYWIAAADGGVFTFGDAGYFGSPSAPLSGGPGGSAGGTVVANPVIAMAASPDGQGYLLLPSAPGLDPATPGYTGYELAKREWQFSQLDAAVWQSVTWQQAASYLVMGERVDPGNRSGYAAAINELTQMSYIPNMGVTPAQQAEGIADTKALNAFFGTNLRFY